MLRNPNIQYRYHDTKVKKLETTNFFPKTNNPENLIKTGILTLF